MCQLVKKEQYIFFIIYFITIIINLDYLGPRGTLVVSMLVWKGEKYKHQINIDANGLSLIAIMLHYRHCHQCCC